MAEGRQDHDVCLGVPEELRRCLVEHRLAAPAAAKKVVPKKMVGEQHGHRAREHRITAISR